MKIFLHEVTSFGQHGDALYRATSETGDALYEHISWSPRWGMSDLRGGLSRAGLLDGNEIIEAHPALSNDRPTRPGLYQDPKTGDLWELNPNGWRWVNGGRWNFIPSGLVRVGDYFGHAAAVPTPEGDAANA